MGQGPGVRVIPYRRAIKIWASPLPPCYYGTITRRKLSGLPRQSFVRRPIVAPHYVVSANPHKSHLARSEVYKLSLSYVVRFLKET